MKDRIVLLIKAMNYTAAQFAEEIGVQKSGISHIISGRNNPSLDFIQKILSRFPQVNMEWLINGKGPMIKGDILSGRPPENTLFNSDAAENLAPDLFSVEISPLEGVNPPVEKVLPIMPSTLEMPENSARAPVPNIAHEHNKQEHPKMDPIAVVRDEKTRKIQKIIFFYDDRSFLEYYPEN